MHFSAPTRAILALIILVAASIALPVGAVTPASVPTAASLVKKPKASSPKSYAKPAVGKKVAKSKGAVAERDWTVLYYLDADCNLEAPMLDDIDEMEMIGSTDNVNLLVLLDRTPAYDDRDGDWANSRLLFVTRDAQEGKIQSQVLENLNEMDTADPRTLVEFVTFGMQNFPAKHYALVLGNHGGTWMGMINDDTDNEAGMRLAPFVEALAALKAGGAPKLDLIAFDMCLMAQVEVMDAIAPYASFGVASEELEPGMGYPNHRVLHALTSNPKMSPREFAQSMVQEWTASYAEAGEATVTSSATDLAKLPDLMAAVDALAAALGQAPGPVQAAALRARAATHSYGGEEGGGDLASFDLGEFASLLAEQPEAAALKPQLDAVLAAVKAAVVEHGEGAAHKGSTGLAIYFPVRGKVHADYASIPFARGGWDDFLKKGLSTGGGSGSGGGGSGGKLIISSPDASQAHRLGKGLKIAGKVSGTPASLRASIGFRDPDGSITTISDEEIPSSDARKLANGSLLSTWDDGETFSFTLRPTVRAISDGKNSRLAPTTPLSPGSPYVRADASYNSLMGDLQVSTIFDTQTGKLETIFCLNEKGASNPTAVHPVKGERLVFYQPVTASGDQPARFRPVPALVASGSAKGAKGAKKNDSSGFRLIDTGLPAGNYILSLTAYDGAGRPSGRAELRLIAGGEGAAPGLGYPSYGLPAVSYYDIQFVDLTLIIPAAEYGHFEATWSDYDYMEWVENDDYSSQDLLYLDAVALDASELRFDEANWSNEYEDESLEHDGDLDDDGALDLSDLDDDNDGTPDAADLDDDNDGAPDATDDDEDNDGVTDDEDEDDDSDGTPDASDLDDDNDGTADDADDDVDEDDEADDEDDAEDSDEDGDGTPDETDLDDDNDGTADAADLDDDNDGSPDDVDSDDDNDGTSDAEESDEDDDGTPDDEDSDDDNDGTSDDEDADDDNDGTADDADPDDDNDGTSDEDEADSDDDEAEDDGGDDEAEDDGGDDEAEDDGGDDEAEDGGGDDEAEDDGGDDEAEDDGGDDDSGDDGGGDDGGDDGEK